MSGGQGKNEPYPEAEGMRRYLVKKGIDESRIIKEDKSVNTVQNIQNSMKLIEKENPQVGNVSSNFQVYRGVNIAKKQGLTDVCGIAGNVEPFYLPTNLFREFFGVVKDTIMGNMYRKRMRMIEQKKQTIKKRILFGIATIILLVVEVLIALFVHDSIIRPYLGDVLVVVVIYTFARIIIPERVAFLP